MFHFQYFLLGFFFLVLFIIFVDITLRSLSSLPLENIEVLNALTVCGTNLCVQMKYLFS
jgi:hypothetical protein